MREYEQKLAPIFELVDQKQSSTRLIQYFKNQKWCQISKNSQISKSCVFTVRTSVPADSPCPAGRGCAQPCRHPQSQDDFIQIEIGMGGNEWACSNKQRICPFPGLDLGLTTQKDRRVWSGKGR
jgi:hypothetical protein